MGQLKLVIVAVFVTVLANQKTFVKGQGSLQIEPIVDQHVRNSLDSGVFSSKPTIPNKKDASIQDDQTLEWRLPREVLPSHYEVKIAPVLDAGQENVVGEQWTVPGEAHITVTAQRATNSIVLHSNNITIHNVTVTQGLSEIAVTNVNVSNVHDFLIVSLGSSLQQGQSYLISIHFTSYIPEGDFGLYRSSYIDPTTGNTFWIATTQFEAVSARMMFPAFDEPALKSTFNFTIGRLEKYVALFNTELTTTVPGPTGWVWDSYLPTVKMSTYLLAVVISEFTYEEAPSDLLPGKKVRTYAPAHYINEEGGVYSAAKAANILAFFNDYFDLEFPMSKMDSAAVPNFWFGAMENYGLNIYRESALLYFPDRSLETERWGVAGTLAHELAHQWFGDLVSPAWWTHIWLNEGFATYLESVVSDSVTPEFEPKKRLLNDAIQRAMDVAANPANSHPIKIGEEEWATKWAMDWFDNMAYQQAASIIRMMDGILTTPIFNAGLKTYLNRLQYSAAQQDDLFHDLNILAEATDKLPNNLTVKDVMDTWTLQAGFPVVRVNKQSSTQVDMSQERFVNYGAPASAESWHIPVSIATASSPNFDPEPENWLTEGVETTSWAINAEEWLIFNAGATGFYRVLYDEDLTALIKAQLDADHSVIDPFTRSQLLDDYFAFGYQRYNNLEAALSLTSYLGKEDEFIVWNTALKHLRKALNLFSSTENYAGFTSYLLPKIKSALALTGGVDAEFPDRAGNPIIRHQLFMDWACAMEDEECQNFAVDLVSQWSDTFINNVPRDLQQIVYCGGVAKGNTYLFNFIKEVYYGVETTTIQQGRLLNGLGCATDPVHISQLLQGSITPGYFLSTAHGATMLQRLAMTPVGRAQARGFIRENAEAIRSHFGSASPIAGVFTTAATYVSTTAELQDLEAIVSEIADTIVDVRPTIDAALNTIRANIAWMEYFGGSFIGGL